MENELRVLMFNTSKTRKFNNKLWLTGDTAVRLAERVWLMVRNIVNKAGELQTVVLLYCIDACRCIKCTPVNGRVDLRRSFGKVLTFLSETKNGRPTRTRLAIENI